MNAGEPGRPSVTVLSAAPVIAFLAAMVPACVLASLGYFGWLVKLSIAWVAAEVTLRLSRSVAGRSIQFTAAIAAFAACVIGDVVGEFTKYCKLRSEVIDSLSEIVGLFFSVHINKIPLPSLLFWPFVAGVFASGVVATRQRRLRSDSEPVHD